jgi:hypothetical protein
MPNLAILIIAVIIMLLISHASSENRKKKFYEQRAKLANPPEHAWVDNDPSGGAVFVCVVIAIIAVVAAFHF